MGFAIAALLPLITSVALGMAKPLAVSAVGTAVGVGVGAGIHAATGNTGLITGHATDTTTHDTTTTARRKRSIPSRLILRLLAQHPALRRHLIPVTPHISQWFAGMPTL